MTIPDPERAGETLVKYTLYLNIIGLILGFFTSSKSLFWIIVVLSILMLVLRKGFIYHSPLIIAKGVKRDGQIPK